jgi:hypothetical protein
MELRDDECYLHSMNKKNPSSTDGFPTIIPPVTPYMVRARTVELAIRAGRNPTEIRQRDYEQAKRELTGETDFDRQSELLYGC